MGSLLSGGVSLGTWLSAAAEEGAFCMTVDKRKRSVQSQMPSGYGAGGLPTARMRSFSRLSSVASPETRQPCSQGRAELCDCGRFTATEEFGALTGVIAMHTTTGGTAVPPRGARG